MGNKGGDGEGLEQRETARERETEGGLSWNKVRHYHFNDLIFLLVNDVGGRYTYIHVTYILAYPPLLSHSFPLFHVSSPPFSACADLLYSIACKALFIQDTPSEIISSVSSS